MARIPLAYTFGNHMHWVDMEWLWGYHVLPGSVRDMIHLCQEAGVKGCVNFDGIGYEKLAVENPEAFQELREAIRSGLIEVVGASYGQPYGLFHGGESNIRQRVYGIRTCMRLFGVRPRTFWEEEFDFFPQLPQILAGCGFTGASLYFQWTWHTPEIPREEVPVILWEGLDGTRLPTATRNRLNLHQWPEDMDILLKELVDGIESARKTAKALHRAEGEGMIDRDEIEDTAITIAEGPKPLILQWLELMPSPDWMCRSEVILPKLRELLDDDRFEIERLTLGEYLAANSAGAPVRRYGMDEVWHGMTLGKNGDSAPRRSREIESQILASETLQATLSLFGRPYANWDVYPGWEMDEAWRNLLAAQHHDNHECEGLCGDVAEGLYRSAGAYCRDGRHGMDFLESQVKRDEGELVTFNPQGWSLGSVGAFGYSAAAATEESWLPLDLASGALPFDSTLPYPFSKYPEGSSPIIRKWDPKDPNDDFWALTDNGDVGAWARVSPDGKQVRLVVSFEPLQPLPPGMNSGGRMVFPWRGFERIIADTPYGVAEVRPGGKAQKKYPTGDWMTSPQWFESVEGHFTSLSFVDFVRKDGSGVLVVHNGSMQWFFTEDGLENLIAVNDPWDEEKASSHARVRYWIIEHGPMGNAERWKRGRERFGESQDWSPSLPLETERADAPISGHLPRAFSPVVVNASNVDATAFYREIEEFAGRGLDNYAGQGMGYPFILRLVEFDGIGGDVEVTLPGPIAKAVKTNLMGERASESQPSLSADVTSPQFPSVTGPLLQGEGEATSPVGEVGEPKRTGWGDAHPPALPDLPIKPGDPRALLATPEELAPFGIRAETITVPMRPYEIATIYLDLVPGRKQSRDLDAKREVWATVHRTS